MSKISNNDVARLKALQDCGVTEQPINSVFEKITRMAKLLFKVPIVSVTVLAKDKQLLKSVQGLDVDETPLDDSFCAYAIDHPEILIVEDARADQRFKDNPLVTGGPNIVFYAGCPIAVNDQQRIGTLCLIDNKPRVLTEEEKNCLQDLAEMVEVEINKKYLKNKVQDLSSILKSANKEKCTDDLTNVYNRRGIREIFYQLLEANATSDSGLYVIMIDMDNLKKINDNLGHKQGDLVLKNFAKMCIRTLRPHDYFARIGGDEFVALIQTFEEAKLRIVLDRLLSSTKKLNVELEMDQHNITIGMTIGAVTCKYSDNNNFENIIHEADQLLYEGKKNGKNQYIIKK